MSNDRFKEYVRSGAFTLTLSERMIKILFHLAGCGEEDERLNLTPYQSLQRRGLAEYEKGKGFVITNEGYIVVDLLICAGYSNGDPPMYGDSVTPMPRNLEGAAVAGTGVSSNES